MAMKLIYNIENFGNIDRASITIKPLTIIAGENSSGKTFVTKSLYTILSQIGGKNSKTTLSKNLDFSFKKNFEITNLQNLIKHNRREIKLSFKNIAKIIIDNSLKLEVNMENLEIIDNILFIDSPIYLKIRTTLQKRKISSFNSTFINEKYLKGYPEYLDILYDFIDKEYIDIADFNEISHEIQKMIRGKLVVGQNGNINYTDDDNHTIPLSLTAMGISNIGLIELLLRNNTINRGSFLIMDEPEVHLHPQWQVFLAKILYKIAKGGANIVIATHSLDFLKAFENILKEDEEKAENIIAINKMPYDDEFSQMSELEKIGIVLDDLSRPYYDLYMQDI